MSKLFECIGWAVLGLAIGMTVCYITAIVF